MAFLHHFTPDLLVDSIYDIPLDQLSKNGIKGMMFDLDNTLTKWHGPIVGEEIYQWFASLSGYGISPVLVSNSHKARVRMIADDLHIPFVYDARKPMRGGFVRALTLLGLRPHQIAMVGDQIFTDVLGGNRVGVYTILVKPISPEEMWGTRHISRRGEKIIRRFIRRDLENRK